MIKIFLRKKYIFANDFHKWNKMKYLMKIFRKSDNKNVDEYLNYILKENNY